MTTGTESATYRMRIGGEWRSAGDGRTRPVLNPATGEAFAVVPEGTREDARAALEAAQAAQPAWEALTGVERAAYVRRIVERITADSERLARLVVQEQGKPLVEARGEIAGTAGFFEYFTTFARSPLGEIVASDNRDEDIWIRNVPFGVVVGIIPCI
jgi:lactaldehyde dehydrogenase/glycolaldehyde dehydrogenase